MNQFIQCMCYNNLQALVVQGEATAEQLLEAWIDLFYEYCDLAEATETTYRARLLAEIELENTKNMVVDGWVKMMKLYYSPLIADALRKVGFDYELNPHNVEEYMAELGRIQGELVVNRLRVRILEAEYTAMMEAQSTHDSVDEKYFRTIFFRINNYAKREAVNGMTTVADYCAALKDFVAYLEVVNKKPATNGRV